MQETEETRFYAARPQTAVGRESVAYPRKLRRLASPTPLGLALSCRRSLMPPSDDGDGEGGDSCDDVDDAGKVEPLFLT